MVKLTGAIWPQGMGKVGGEVELNRIKHRLHLLISRGAYYGSVRLSLTRCGLYRFICPGRIGDGEKVVNVAWAIVSASVSLVSEVQNRLAFKHGN